MLLASFAVADTTPRACHKTRSNPGITMAVDRNYKDSRILVTGGAGFTGSHLSERLLADLELA
jgi:FlaA1/EpsC-like NDP-sugar epimerase